MRESVIRDKVMEEIKLIPEDKLSEIYDVIHYFWVGLQKSNVNINQIMQFAGCWNDIPEDVFNNFLEETRQRRSQAFSRRRGGGTSIS
ncbi:MAG: hypothetical protein AB1567_03170 [bacterium]